MNSLFLKIISIINPHPIVKTNNLLSEQLDISNAHLDFLFAESSANKTAAASALRNSIVANIIATVAIIIATKDSIITMVISWFS